MDRAAALERDAATPRTSRPPAGPRPVCVSEPVWTVVRTTSGAWADAPTPRGAGPPAPCSYRTSPHTSPHASCSTTQAALLLPSHPSSHIRMTSHGRPSTILKDAAQNARSVLHGCIDRKGAARTRAGILRRSRIAAGIPIASSRFRLPELLSLDRLSLHRLSLRRCSCRGSILCVRSSRGRRGLLYFRWPRR